jgi:hypothetical protein
LVGWGVELNGLLPPASNLGHKQAPLRQFSARVHPHTASTTFKHTCYVTTMMHWRVSLYNGRCHLRQYFAIFYSLWLRFEPLLAISRDTESILSSVAPNSDRIFVIRNVRFAVSRRRFNCGNL